MNPRLVVITIGLAISIAGCSKEESVAPANVTQTSVPVAPVEPVKEADPLKAEFAAMDTAKKGYLDATDIAKAQSALGPVGAQAMLNDLDLDKNGSLSFEEWSTPHKTLAAAMAKVEASPAEAKSKQGSTP